MMEQSFYNESAIAQYLQTEWLGRKLFFYPEIGSTNEQAKLVAKQTDAHGAVVVADMQTAGRGRRGRAWDSPAGTNVYFTLVLKPVFAADKASMLTLLMAYAVQQALEKREIDARIKWPNDIVIQGKKICGILTELQLEGTAIHHVAIGVGINVGAQNFAPELAEKATSLEQACGQRVPRSQLLADIMYYFELEYEHFVATCDTEGLVHFKDKYNACLVNRDREVCVLDPKGEYGGTARGINDMGELLVELADGTVTAVYAGEVSVRGIYGYV